MSDRRRHEVDRVPPHVSAVKECCVPEYCVDSLGSRYTEDEEKCIRTCGNCPYRLITSTTATFGLDPKAQHTPASDLADGRVYRLSEGTTQILQLQIAKHMLGEWAQQA